MATKRNRTTAPPKPAAPKKDPMQRKCSYRVDNDIPAGPGPWVCSKLGGHPGPHNMVKEASDA